MSRILLPLMPDRSSRALRGAAPSFGVALLCCMVAGAAFADVRPDRGTVAGVRAAKACLREEVRITGFAVARDANGANLMLPGYRVTDILVAEGDQVVANQELARATREPGADPQAQAGGQGLPPAMSVRAPIAGRVTRINLHVGAISGAMAAPAPGAQPDPQFLIEADTSIDLLVDVPSIFATQLKTGLAAKVISESGREIKGSVRVPVSEIDPATQLGRARIAIDPASALRLGQFASVVLETARNCGVTVPRSAVSVQNGASLVQVLNGGVVETRVVRTGLADSDRIQIRDGLSEGEPIVANAGASLRSGDRVTPIVRDMDDRTSN